MGNCTFFSILKIEEKLQNWKLKPRVSTLSALITPLSGVTQIYFIKPNLTKCFERKVIVIYGCNKGIV
jgi:hypothetical protein